jgi:hypothetical protein
MRAETILAARQRVTKREMMSFVGEALFLFVAMIIYFLVRGGLPERAGEAFSRANQVIQLEQRLGIFVELEWQEQILGSIPLMKLANWIYVWGHLPVLIFAAVWIYLRNRERYRVYRNALLISAFIGLFAYGLFPVAPPRLMPEWGFVDTVAYLTRENYDMQPGFFVNHYAAVPSLHFGWALLICIALFDVDRNFFIRLFAVVSTAAMFFAVVLTANHFIFDMLVGSFIVLLSIAIAFMLQEQRLPVPSLRRQQA